jgi:hypothetical protein
MVAGVGILFSLCGAVSSGLETDGLDQCVKVIDDAVIEAVELRPVCTETLSELMI